MGTIPWMISFLPYWIRMQPRNFRGPWLTEPTTAAMEEQYWMDPGLGWVTPAPRTKMPFISSVTVMYNLLPLGSLATMPLESSLLFDNGIVIETSEFEIGRHHDVAHVVDKAFVGKVPELVGVRLLR
jgi:hypothetical protein